MINHHSTLLSHGVKRKMLLAAAICAAASQAQASGYQVMENSPVAQGMAMAGSGASPDDVTAIFNNPAALGFVKKDQIYLGTSYLFANVKMHDATAEHSEAYPAVPLSVSGDNESDHVVKNTPIPSLYGAWHINDQLTAGLSFTTPWGMSTDYSNDSVVRFMAQKTEMAAYNLTPMLSYKINPRLSVAAGLQAQYMEMEISNYNGTADDGSMFKTDYPTNFKMNGWGAGFILGLMAQPFDNTYVGLSYRSRVDMHLSGDGEHYFYDGGLTPSVDDGETTYNGKADIATDMDTPAVVNLSITQILTPKWDIRATAQYTHWSQFEHQKMDVRNGFQGADTTIDYNWHNTWYLALGSSYKLTPDLTLRTGVAWDQTPTSNATRDARTPDADRTIVAFGASYQLQENMRLDFGYQHFFMKDTSIDVTQIMGSGHTDSGGSASQELNHVSANYSGSADIVAIGFNYQF